MATWQMYSDRPEASIQDVTRGVAFGFTSLIFTPGFPLSDYADLAPVSLHRERKDPASFVPSFGFTTRLIAPRTDPRSPR